MADVRMIFFRGILTAADHRRARRTRTHVRETHTGSLMHAAYRAKVRGRRARRA